MRLTCPHCHRPIEVVAADTANAKDADCLPNSSVTTCPACGSELPMYASTVTYQREPPQRLGPFELRDRLGQGQFGVVWKAWDTELGRFVALKFPRSIELFDQGEGAVRKEARAVAALDHPNIVRLHEVRHEPDSIVIVTEYIEGTTLQRHMASGAYSYNQMADVCRQIAEALHHAHERGVVHRDIKPSNILINQEGVPKLADFGLAKRDAAEITMTVDGVILGTPAYMPPEQAKGHSHSADCRSDVYSLGVVLYEMLTGTRPFSGSSRALLDQVISCDPRAPRRISKSIPRDLETICLRAMAKDPARRYQTAGAFAADLQRYLRSEVIEARPATMFERSWKWSRRHPWQIATTLLGVAVLAVGLGWNLAPRKPGEPTQTVTLDTKPSNAKLVFYRRDPKTGEPLPRTAIRPRSRSPLTISLPPGDYLVVAVLDDGRFHEVYRRVPLATSGMSPSYLHLKWEMKDNQIRLPEIEIPEQNVVENMVFFSGSKRFQMGVVDDMLIPQHERTVPPFYLDPHEVTFRQFRAMKKRLPSAWNKDTPIAHEDLAAHRMFHDEVIAFAEASGKRLMTEAEYELAATYGGTQPYPWGARKPAAAWPIDPVSDSTADRLDTKPPVFGLFSNVAEWTDSWGTPYPGHLATNIDLGSSLTGTRVVRGAPSYVALKLPVPAKRDEFTPRHRLILEVNSLPENVGFRMAKSYRPRLQPEDFEAVLNNEPTAAH